MLGGIRVNIENYRKRAVYGVSDYLILVDCQNTIISPLLVGLGLATHPSLRFIKGAQV
jgi:hypothetical protein